MANIISNINCSGGSLIFNGKKYNVNGQVVITTEGFFINGKSIEKYEEAPVFKIEIHGNVDSIESENASIEVNGDVNSVNTKNGNVQVGRDVKGNAETKNGNILVSGKVMGDVTTKNGNISHL